MSSSGHEPPDRDAKPSKGSVVDLPGTRRLAPGHEAHLATSCLTAETLAAARIYSESDPKRLAAMLGWKSWPKIRGSAIAFPFYRPGESDPYAYRVKPDKPRTSKSGKLIKYEQPKEESTGLRVMPYLPPRTRAGMLDGLCPVLWTEGEKKALYLDQLGFCVVGGTGVDCFHDTAHRELHDEYILHPWLRDGGLRIAGRDHVLVFDADVHHKPEVQRAMSVLAGMLERAGAKSVTAVLLPESGPKGVDDIGYALRLKHIDAGAAPEDAAALADAEVMELLTRRVPVVSIDPGDASPRVASMRHIQGAPVPDSLRWPDGYEVDRHGLWLAPPEEKRKLVMPSPVLLSRVLIDAYSHEERLEVVFRRAGAWRRAVVDRRDLGDRRGVLDTLRPLGCAVDTNNASEVIRFLSAFEAKNERRFPRVTCVPRCGWHEVEGEWVFSAPEVIGGSDDAIVFDGRHGRAAVASGLRCGGDIDAHHAALQTAWRASPEAAVAICVALAAPLLRPLGAPLFAVHLLGDSSKGKSSMLRIAASVFGDPMAESWVTSWDTTSVGLEVRAALLCDLPCILDESGVAPVELRERAVYSLINGQGRVRGAKDGGLRETSFWRTLVLSTGETELVRRTEGATGQRVRVLTVEVHGFGALDAAQVDAVRNAAIENFGHVGREWLEQVCAQTPAHWLAARDRLTKYVEFFEKSAPNSLRARQARFWALLRVVEDFARTVLDLGTADGSSQVERVASGQVGDEESVRPLGETALDVTSDWLRRRRDGVVTLRREMSASGGWRLPNVDPRRETLAYIAGDEVWLIPSALRDEFGKRGLDDNVLRVWSRDGVTVTSPGRTSTTRRVEGAKGRFIVLPSAMVGVEPDTTLFDDPEG